MQYLQELYTQFLGYFPNFLQPFVSVALAVLLVYSIFQALKRNFLYLIVLVVLLPASVPILKGVWEALLNVIKFLLGKA